MAGPTDEERREAVRRLNALADRLEPDLRRKFRRAMESLRRSDIWAEVTAALDRGDFAAAVRLIDVESFENHAEPFRRAIRRAVEQGGDYGVEQVSAALTGGSGRRLPTGTGSGGNSRIPVQFNMQNPQTAEELRRYELNLIRDIDAGTREGIRAHLLDGRAAGENPRATARRIRPIIGLTRRQQQAVRNFERLLREANPEALDRALRDRRFDPTLRRVIDRGGSLTEEQIGRMTQRYRERFLKYRAEVIARTEGIRAATLGQNEAWRQNWQDGPLAGTRILRFWSHANDDRVRISHRLAEELNEEGVPPDGMFRMGSGARLRYPRDPQGPAEDTIQCRCATIYRVDPGD